MQTRAPEYFEELCSVGRGLVSLARSGRLDQIKHEIHFKRAQGHLLTYYNCKMMLAACSYGRIEVMKFMIENGMPVKHPGMLDILHRAVEAEGMTLDSMEAKSIVVSFARTSESEFSKTGNVAYPRCSILAYRPSHIASSFSS